MYLEIEVMLNLIQKMLEKRNINEDVFFKKLQLSNNPKEFVDSFIEYVYINRSNDNITCVSYWNSNV